MKQKYTMIWAGLLTFMMIISSVTVITGSVKEAATDPAGVVVDDTIDTVTLQPNATDGKDNWMINNTFDYNNYGNDSSLFSGYGWPLPNTEPRSLLSFDTSGVPTNVNLLRATLALYSYQPSINFPFGVNVSVYPLTESWTEGNGTIGLPSQNYSNWANSSTGTPWTTPGGDYDNTSVSYRNVSLGNTWYEWDITQIVDDWLNDVTVNNGVLLIGQPINILSNIVGFYSSDYTVDTNLTPKLTLSYAVEIDPPVPGQTFTEDDPMRTIDLRGIGEGTIVKVSSQANASSMELFNGSQNQIHSQSVYMPNQVGAEGVIKRVSFNRSLMEVGNFSNFKLSMAHTNRTNVTTTFANNYYGYLIEVFSAANVELNSSNNDSWVHFDLNGNFTYDSSYNLLVDIEWIGDGDNNVTIDTTNFTEPKRVWSSTGGAIGIIDPGPVYPMPVIRFETDVVDNAVVDEGTANNFWPFAPGTQPEMRQQMLYNYTMINNSGLIDIIRFQSNNIGPQWGVVENLSIRMAHSQNDSLGTVFEANRIDGWVEVLNRTSYNITTLGRPEWIEFDIDNTFNYNGNDNLLIEVRWFNGYGSNINLLVNLTSTYNGQMATSNYSATTGTALTRVYNLQTIFLESVNLTWTAYSSDESLFMASAVGNQLFITPVADAFGSGTATLWLTNSNGEFVTQAIPVTINPVNDAPVIGSLPDMLVTEDITYTYNVTLDLTDVDNDVANLTINTDSPNAVPEGHLIRFTYPEGWVEDNVTLTVKDPQGGTATALMHVIITPVNDEPTMTSAATFTVDAGVPTEFILSFDDEETPDNITIYVDNNYTTRLNNTLTITIPKGIGTDLITIDAVDGFIHGSQNNVSFLLTVTAIDHPDVISNSPTGSGVSLITTIAVTFDVAMDTATVESGFSLSTAARAVVNGTFSWNDPNTTMTFTPDGYLDVDTEYDVMIGTGAADVNGTAMLEAYAWNFTVSGAVDSDGDGMPDGFELDNGLDPGVNDANGDKDGDGMPNLWEYENGLDPAVDDAAGDIDEDGVTNLEEYLAGTDPNNPEDRKASNTWIMIVLALIVVAVLGALFWKFMLSSKPEKQGEDHEPPPPEDEFHDDYDDRYEDTPPPPIE